MCTARLFKAFAKFQKALSNFAEAFKAPFISSLEKVKKKCQVLKADLPRGQRARPPQVVQWGAAQGPKCPQPDTPSSVHVQPCVRPEPGPPAPLQLLI